MLNKDALKTAFAQMGIGPGMHLMVHSSLRSFGHVEGGPDAILDALMELVTPEGTLMFPTFNHDACYSEGQIFDVRNTPTINGIIPETFRHRPGVLRSNSPTHAFAAWGKNARRYILNHENVITMGEGSPLDLLMQDGGYCLLLGVGYNRNTFHHCVEMLMHAPCLGRNNELYPMITRDGEHKMIPNWGWRNAGCPLNDAAAYAPQMEAIHTQLQIGEATCTMYRLQEGFEIIARNMREGLGDIKPCSECHVRPRIAPYTVR